jgi:hypothetical protein
MAVAEVMRDSLAPLRIGGEEGTGTLAGFQRPVCAITYDAIDGSRLLSRQKNTAVEGSEGLIAAPCVFGLPITSVVVERLPHKP